MARNSRKSRRATQTPVETTPVETTPVETVETTPVETVETTPVETVETTPVEQPVFKPLKWYTSEFNRLVPRAHELGLARFRVHTSLFETKAKGAKQLAILIAAIEAAATAQAQAQAISAA